MDLIGDILLFIIVPLFLIVWIQGWWWDKGRRLTMKKFKVGTRVRVIDSKMSIAWNMVNEVGTVTGRDPKGFNKKVVAVKLDSKSAICEAGIHIDHLEVIPKVKRRL